MNWIGTAFHASYKVPRNSFTEQNCRKERNVKPKPCRNGTTNVN